MLFPATRISCSAFRHRAVSGCGGVFLIRRSQRAKVRWERLDPLLEPLDSFPRVLHPYPDARFAATHPR